MPNRIDKYREVFINDWFSVSGKLLFLLLCVTYFGVLFLKRTLVFEGIAAFEILQERGEVWFIDLFVGLQYMTIPVYLIWKFSLTAFILWVGCFMFGYRVTYSQLWKLTSLMELIFLIPEFLKIIFFMAGDGNYSFEDVQNYYPLSLASIFDAASLNGRWVYPLKAVNLFELIYWLGLTLGICWISGKKLRTSILIVASSYVLFFFLWLVYFVAAYR